MVAGILILGQVSANAQTYSGQATGVRATVSTPGQPIITTAIADTGPLASGGGTITLSSATSNITGILSAGASTATTSGTGNTSQSTASLSNLDMQIVGAFRIRADVISSSTQCTCPTGTCTGSSVITNLQTTGPGNVGSITASGAPNQTIVANVGTLTITLVVNQQITSPNSITVNGLRITVSDSLTGVSTDIVVASSHSDIDCVFSPPSDLYSGRATGVRLAVSTFIPASHTTTLIADTGFLPTSGGNISVTTAGAGVAGVLSTGVVTSNTSGGLPGGSVDTAQSDSTVTNLNASLIGAVTIAATLIESDTQCQCTELNIESCSGTSQVVNLAVVAGGIPVSITVTGAPNQMVVLPLGLGTIIINEQISAGPGDITVNALHVILTPLGLASTDLVIAHSHSDIHCSIGTTAALATLSGRVLDSNGRPLARATVRVSDAEGNMRSTLTNPFGYYRIADLPAAKTYFVGATHRYYTFATRSLTMSDDLDGFDLTPQ